jgi:hypothetical protein
MLIYELEQQRAEATEKALDAWRYSGRDDELRNLYLQVDAVYERVRKIPAATVRKVQAGVDKAAKAANEPSPED